MEEKLFVKRPSVNSSDSRRKWLIGLGGCAVLLIAIGSWFWLSGLHGSPGEMFVKRDKVVKEIPKSAPPQESAPQASPTEGEPSTTLSSQDDVSGSPQETTQVASYSGETTADRQNGEETASAADPSEPARPEAESSVSSAEEPTPAVLQETDESAQGSPAESQVKQEETVPEEVRTAEAPSTSPAVPEKEMTATDQPSQTTASAEPSQTGDTPLSQAVQVAKIKPETSSPSTQTENLPASTKTRQEQKNASKPTHKSAASKSRQPANGQTFYIVRLGSFKVKQNADQMYNTLKKKGYEVEMGTYRHHKLGNLHTVQLKPVDDIPKAQLLISQIKKDENINAFMIREIEHQ